MNLIRLYAVARKEFRQLVRDWRTLFILAILPAVLLLIFGYALSYDIKNVPLAILDHDRTPTSRSLIQSMLGAESFALAGYIERDADIAPLLDEGRADVVLVIPKGFGADVARGTEPRVQALLDGSNAMKATTALSYLQAHITEFGTNVMLDVAQRMGMPLSGTPVSTEPRIWYNPELRSSMFLVPGLMVFVLMVSATTSTALAVVKEKERNTIEQILVSPVNATELILGKTLPYLIVAMCAAGLLVATGWVLFGVAVRGSIPLLAMVSFMFCLAALGQGMLISSATDSQQVAFFASVLSTMLPTFLLSGFVFPLEGTPVAIQLISHLVPSRYFIALVRGVILRDAGVLDLWRPLILLTVFATSILALASVRVARTRI